MSSIREVAKRAGVSPATVSRVMNGTANVNDEKRERVLCAIKETGFVPNEVARTLFKKSAKIIGLVLPNIENPFFVQLASAVEQKANETGYRVILYNTNSEFEKEKMALQMMVSMNADGIIFTRTHTELLAYLSESPIPIVVTDTALSSEADIAYIHCDYYQGGRLATEHLIQCGCKKIVCMRGLQTLYSARSRFEGYRDVCKEHGLELRIVETDYSFEMGLTAAEEMIDKYPDLDGVVACNDLNAISAYKVLHKKNINVPEQVQIVGFDGIFLTDLLTPELTTIVQPIKSIGTKAVELIIHSDEYATEMGEFIFPVTLSEKETTRKQGGLKE